MKDFIRTLKKQLLSTDLKEVREANLALFAYDLGRSVTKENEENARKQWDFRFCVFERKEGLKEGLRLHRKYYGRSKNGQCTN